jgi:type VI secretion system secreted protein VgrG
MVITDSTSKHVAAPGCAQLPYLAPGQLARADIDHVSSWDFAREIHSVGYVHTDYDFEKPKVKLETQKTLPRPTTPGNYEVFDYPGGYIEKPDGLQYAGVRMEEIGTQYEAARAATNARGLTTGCLLKLERFPRPDQNREYLVVSSSHDLNFSAYEGIAGGTSEYRCSFVAMSTTEQFRPARATPKPFVQGPQTAVVTGPPGEEIHTDQYGRVKVQFFWDRLGKEDQDSSCWIRVSSHWAGKNWGGIWIPRMGQEVIVDFLEGDPDQPIITGRVYNAEQMPPYELPAHKTQSGVKSRSSLKGTPDNFNEIRFEDEKGKEHIVIHAERNLNTTVEANERRTVGNNVSVTIGTNPKGDPKKNGMLTTTIFGDTKTTIQKGDLSLDVQTGKMTEHVKGVVEQTFEDTLKTTVTNEIKLICGASSITLKKDGTIEIVGKDIKINGSTSVATDSAKIDSVATGVHTVKGSLVKINS